MATPEPSASENKRRGAYIFWGFLLGVGFSALLDSSNSLSIGSLFPEIFGITITVGVLGWLNNRRAQRDLEAELMRRIRSSVRDVAVAAVEELKFLGYFDQNRDTFNGVDLSGVQWAEANLRAINLAGTKLVGSNLKGADLFQANLVGANLENANLEKANLFDSNLQKVYMNFANLQFTDVEYANLNGAQLMSADLQEANLLCADLRGGNLVVVDLRKANLAGAILQGADLRRADLRGARLVDANLQGANLKGARFDEKTALPDNSMWTPDTDMDRFTDPNHPFARYYPDY